MTHFQDCFYFKPKRVSVSDDTPSFNTAVYVVKKEMMRHYKNFLFYILVKKKHFDCTSNINISWS